MAVLPFPCLLSYFRPQDLLLSLPFPEVLEQMFPRLCPVLAPPAGRAVCVFRPFQVLPSAAVPRSELGFGLISAAPRQRLARRIARRIAQWTMRARQPPGSLRDGSSVVLRRRLTRQIVGGRSAHARRLPDGLRLSLRRMVRFEMGPAYCLSARWRRFGGWFGSRRARRIARRLARDASADGSDRDGPGVLPDGSLATRWQMFRP